MRTLLLILVLSIISITSICNALDLDPQYYTVFGEKGVLVFSTKMLPAKDHYDASLFEYKDGISYLKPGANAQVFGRLILPKGKTFGDYLTKLKRENAKNTQHIGKC